MMVDRLIIVLYAASILWLGLVVYAFAFGNGPFELAAVALFGLPPLVVVGALHFILRGW